MLTLLRLGTYYPESGVTEGGFPLPPGYASMCRLATGRSALFHLATRLSEHHACTVLLPCYVAEGVIKPFIAAGFAIRFYPLKLDLRPDENAVAEMLEDISDRAIFVLIHYFGYSTASPSLLALLANTDAWVVSDCAHAPLSRAEDGRLLGEVGDFALYSLNKWLPVCDGAILLSASEDVSVSINETDLPTLPPAAIEAFQKHLTACRALFSAATPDEAVKKLELAGTSYETYYEIINNDMIPHRQSDASRRIEAVFEYDAAAQIRRAHASRLEEEMTSHIFEFVHSSLPAGAVPFCVPVRVPSQRRSELESTLFERGILLSRLDHKWDFVPDGPSDQFVVERTFLKEHLLIPVNEFLSDADVSHLIFEMNRIQ